MERIPEVELMLGEEQAKAYAEADFSNAHDLFVETLKQKLPNIPSSFNDVILDLGCGPCDVTRRLAIAYPDAGFHAVDGAAAMLKQGAERNKKANLATRIKLIETCLPNPELPQQHYHAIVSNSLLHHLHDPLVLWKTIQQHAKPYAHVFVMDLIRPVDEQTVAFLSAEYIKDEPGILKQDFENSLRAAFTLNEVQQQLDETGFTSLKLEEIDELHFAIYGIL